MAFVPLQLYRSGTSTIIIVSMINLRIFCFIFSTNISITNFTLNTDGLTRHKSIAYPSFNHHQIRIYALPDHGERIQSKRTEPLHDSKGRYLRRNPFKP